MLIRRSIVAASLLSCAASPTGAQQKTQSVPVLAFEDSVAIATAATRIASARKQPSAVVVVNREGRVIVAMRMDDVSFLNLEVAQSKAVTAAALGAPTDAIEQAVDHGKASLLSVRDLGAIGGGLPILRDGQVVAGIGVSGGAPADDKAIAEAAIASKR